MARDIPDRDTDQYVASCRFCLYNLWDGVKSLAEKRGQEPQIEVIEVIELLADIIHVNE